MEKPNFLTVDACPQLSYDFGIMSLQFYLLLLVTVFLAGWLFFIYITDHFDKSFYRHSKNEGSSND